MIAFLEGNLLKKEDDRIILLCGHIGYEILLPKIVSETLNNISSEKKISFFIFFHQTERQPKPVLIGFNNEYEREFFQYFITVEAIGPMKAVQAMTIPVQDIAFAIEKKDIKMLSKLKGIGNRTSQKIIATLHGKMIKFIGNNEKQVNKQNDDISYSKENETIPDSTKLKNKVIDVLVNQLGHRFQEANSMVEQAMKKNKDINTPEELLELVYYKGS